MKQKIVVYTAIYGNYDDLKEPSMKLEGCDLVCFTDNERISSRFFDVRVHPPIYSDPARNSCVFRLLPHRFFPEYEYSLWIDGAGIFKTGNIRALIDKYLRDQNMAVFHHSTRDCLYDEAEMCIANKRDDPLIIRKQIEKYKQEQYPRHNGLVTTGAILRRHMSPDVIRVDEECWAEIEKFSRRPEISFNYVAWKNDFKYATFDGIVWDNQYFRFAAHKHRLRDSFWILVYRILIRVGPRAYTSIGKLLSRLVLLRARVLNRQ